MPPLWDQTHQIAQKLFDSTFGVRAGGVQGAPGASLPTFSGGPTRGPGSGGSRNAPMLSGGPTRHPSNGGSHLEAMISGGPTRYPSNGGSHSGAMISGGPTLRPSNGGAYLGAMMSGGPTRYPSNGGSHSGAMMSGGPTRQSSNGGSHLAPMLSGGPQMSASAPAATASVTSRVHRSAIYLMAGHWGAEVNGASRAALSLAFSEDGAVYVDNRAVVARFVTVEIQVGTEWHKAFQHDGKKSTIGLSSCKLRLMHGCVHAEIDGRELKPNAARFEVVG